MLQMNNVERIREAMQSLALALASQPLLTKPTDISLPHSTYTTTNTYSIAIVPISVPHHHLQKSTPQKVIQYLHFILFKYTDYPKDPHLQ